MSRFEREHERLFTRRAILLTGGKLALLGILAGRMFQLQVVERGKYLTMAEDNRVSPSLIAPERGLIYDRFNVPLAVNVQDFRLLLTEELAPDIEATLNRLDRYVPMTPERRTRIARDLKRQHRFLPVLVADNLSWEQMAAIEVDLPHLPGLAIEEGKVRSYPLKDATAHVLGYVGLPNEKDLKKDADKLLEFPGFQIGKMGLEQQYDKALRGVAGKAQEEVNATGRKVRVLSRQEGLAGAPLRLTLDAELQLFAQNRLTSERSASAVLLDANNGAVYALASNPAYDPNVFSQGIPLALWQELLADPTNPLTNKAIAGQYPPGSTFKMVTALAGLTTGATSEHRTVFCPGHMKLGSHTFHCWNKNGHGTIKLREAIEQSCDVYFYQVALDTGIDKLAATANKLGLGLPTGIDLPGERGGLIPTQAWKKQKLRESWHLGETAVNAIGQGFVLATPLQLAIMTARLVNGGVPIQPFLAQKLGDGLLHPAPPATRLGFDPGHLALIKEGMNAVVNGNRGTARSVRPKDPAFTLGGKTGSAQVRRITMDERRRGLKVEQMKWEHQDHGLFVGYAPLDNPRYACAVVVEHGLHGGTSAAPIASDLLVEAMRRMPEQHR